MMSILPPRVEDCAEDYGEVGLLLVGAAAGEGDGDAGADYGAAGDGVGVDKPALDQDVRRGQIRRDYAVEAAAAVGAVVILEPRGLLTEYEVVGDGSPQLAVGEGALLLLGHQALSLDRVLHVERHLLHQREQRELGILIAEGLQRVEEEYSS